MILITTLHAEVARLDRELTNLLRARFDALARSDAVLAGRLWREIKLLQTQREELTGSPGLWDTHE